MKFITPVRNPIERNVSVFFHRRNRNGFEWRDCSLSQLRQGLLDEADANYDDMDWFDNHMKLDLGLDVYAAPFPAGGGITWKRKNFDVMVIKLELEEAEMIAHLNRFLGMRMKLPFPVLNASMSISSYGSTYSRFRREVRLPASYLDRMLEHRYARHFYSDEERANVRLRWVEGTP